MSTLTFKDMNKKELLEIAEIHVAEYQVATKRIAELEATNKNIAKAVKRAFTSLVGCDNYLNVHVDRYNEIVAAFNQTKEL